MLDAPVFVFDTNILIGRPDGQAIVLRKRIKWWKCVCHPDGSVRIGTPVHFAGITRPPRGDRAYAPACRFRHPRIMPARTGTRASADARHALGTWQRNGAIMDQRSRNEIVDLTNLYAVAVENGGRVVT